MSGPVLFVHGLFGSFHEPDVASRFSNALAPDLLGYGRFRDADPAAIDLHAQVLHLRERALSAWGDLPITVVGHSVGGAIAMLYADRFPVRSLINVEGNFTLDDAFWSRSLAAMNAEEAEAEIAGFAADLPGWLARSGVPATGATSAFARAWLARQPSSTLVAVARSVVQLTASVEWPETVRSVMDATPLHLIAGSRSRAGWHVPTWVCERAASEMLVPNAGHLMMLDELESFVATLRGLGSESESNHHA